MQEEHEKKKINHTVTEDQNCKMKCMHGTKKNLRKEKKNNLCYYIHKLMPDAKKWNITTFLVCKAIKTYEKNK